MLRDAGQGNDELNPTQRPRVSMVNKNIKYSIRPLMQDISNIHIHKKLGTRISETRQSTRLE